MGSEALVHYHEISGGRAPEGGVGNQLKGISYTTGHPACKRPHFNQINAPYQAAGRQPARDLAGSFQSIPATACASRCTRPCLTQQKHLSPLSVKHFMLLEAPVSFKMLKLVSDL